MEGRADWIGDALDSLGMVMCYHVEVRLVSTEGDEGRRSILRKVNWVLYLQRAYMGDSVISIFVRSQLTFLNAMVLFVIKEWGLKFRKFRQLLRGEEVEDGWSQGQVESVIKVPVPVVYGREVSYSIGSSWLYVVHGCCNNSPETLA